MYMSVACSDSRLWQVDLGGSPRQTPRSPPSKTRFAKVRAPLNVNSIYCLIRGLKRHAAEYHHHHPFNTMMDISQPSNQHWHSADDTRTFAPLRRPLLSGG